MTVVSVSDSWVTWEEAASLAGVRVPTIEHAVRVGRIARRPRSAGGPTLERGSVLSWAAWYRETQAGIARRRAAREASRERGRLRGPRRGTVARLAEAATGADREEPDREGLVRGGQAMTWLSVSEAAFRLDCSESTVLRWAQAGLLVARLVPRAHMGDAVQASHTGTSAAGTSPVDSPPSTISPTRMRVQVSGASVKHLQRMRATDADEWVSQARAAEIVGCSASRIPVLVAEGLLTQRPGPRIQPSIGKDSAVRAAKVWAERVRAEEVARNERRAARPSNAPPDDDDVWVSTATAALALRLSRNRVGDRIRAGTLPAVLRGNRYWLRRADVETAAAARAFELLAVNSPDA